MANIFKSQEILKIAVAIEKNGISFYNSAAIEAKDYPLQGAFKFLAKEEKKHQEVFEGILGRIGDWQPQESYPGEYQLYLEGFASGHLFVKGLSAAKTDPVDFAIGIEKDSIIFYLDLKDFVPATEQSVVDGVIAEERKHLIKLVGLKKGLPAGR